MTIVEQEKATSQLQYHIQEAEARVRFLVIPELHKEIPVYDFRNLAHQTFIAKSLAKGERMAMFGGVWGAFKAVKQNTKEEDFFHKQIKPGRPWEAKVPILVRPKDSIRLVDWHDVHPEFRFLSEYSEFKNLWTSHPAFLHVIAPMRRSKHTVPPVCVTTPEEYFARYRGADSVPVSTIAILHRNDPYHDHLSTLVERYSHTTMYLSVSTLNPPHEEPPSTEKEFFSDIRERRCHIGAIDLVVTDKTYEDTGAFGSHTQVRLPLVGENPTLKVVRIGSLSPEGVKKATGLNYEIIPEAKDVRKSPGVSLDDKLTKMMETVQRNWLNEERRQTNFRS